MVFIRKKKNPSGVISVQVIEKNSGRYTVLKTLGSSKEHLLVDQLVVEGKDWINKQRGITELDFDQEALQYQSILNSITHLRLAGPELVLGAVFDSIGFNQIADNIFRWLVFHRICFPKSKLKTTSYLYQYHGIYWDEDKIYRYLDKLYTKQKEQVQQISYAHTVEVLGGRPGMVFYDVTTLYFEIEEEDDLRQNGFSKEGRHQQPQILLGLLVSAGGYPLAYEIFNGKSFEGHTLIPLIERFKDTYAIEQVVVIADAGLFTQQNLKLLQSHGLEYIIGARIKNQRRQVLQSILALRLQKGAAKSILLDSGERLIISYSEARRIRDEQNRLRGFKKLEKQLRSGRLSKKHLNNRGYNKYLRLEGEVKISIDIARYDADKRWDGLKGYITNSQLSDNEIINNYNQLWQIENAFRVSKSALKVRPIYHRIQRRIEAHICLVFCAYKVYKELERQIKLKHSTLSVTKVIETMLTLYEVTIKSPKTGQTYKRLLLQTQEQKIVAALFNLI